MKTKSAFWLSSGARATLRESAILLHKVTDGTVTRRRDPLFAARSRELRRLGKAVDFCNCPGAFPVEDGDVRSAGSKTPDFNSVGRGGE